MYKIAFFVPESHLEVVKAAMFAAGAGRIGQYDRCSWQVKGTGQFRPLKGADPFIGQVDQVQQVVEYKVEMVCEDEVIHAVVQAMKAAHPYETPAYDVLRLEAI
ncbi:MAG TPA: NGG1p interacting factor NIF3 [Sulfurivirga caldicuralii]|nr:NGG1p interacting factor NIF3 [Sulfurivirga caldicuralii]